MVIAFNLGAPLILEVRYFLKVSINRGILTNEKEEDLAVVLKDQIPKPFLE